RTDDAQSLIVTRVSGELVIESTLQNGIDISVLFGGKAKLIGLIDAEPRTEGDPSALAALADSPEVKLLPELKEVLIASHADAGFYRPTAIGQKRDALWFDGIYEHVAYGESFGFWSWSFWGMTTVVVASEQDPSAGFFAVWFRAGLVGPEYQSGYGM